MELVVAPVFVTFVGVGHPASFSFKGFTSFGLTHPKISESMKIVKMKVVFMLGKFIVVISN